jgi:hypothetical protein
MGLWKAHGRIWMRRNMHSRCKVVLSRESYLFVETKSEQTFRSAIYDLNSTEIVATELDTSVQANGQIRITHDMHQRCKIVVW